MPLRCGGMLCWSQSPPWEQSSSIRATVESVQPPKKCVISSHRTQTIAEYLCLGSLDITCHGWNTRYSTQTLTPAIIITTDAANNKCKTHNVGDIWATAAISVVAIANEWDAQDRTKRKHSAKKRVRIRLCVPKDETSLPFVVMRRWAMGCYIRKTFEIPP
jgi:hypothetical protein